MDIGLKDPTRYALISEEMISKCFEILSGFLEFFKPVVSGRYSFSQHSIGLKSNGLEVRLVAHSAKLSGFNPSSFGIFSLFGYKVVIDKINLSCLTKLK